jgi:hypothetical protein
MWPPIRRFATDLLWSNLGRGWPMTVSIAGTPYTWTVSDYDGEPA